MYVALQVEAPREECGRAACANSNTKWRARHLLGRRREPCVHLCTVVLVPGGDQDLEAEAPGGSVTPERAAFCGYRRCVLRPSLLEGARSLGRWGWLWIQGTGARSCSSPKRRPGGKLEGQPSLERPVAAASARVPELRGVPGRSPGLRTTPEHRSSLSRSAGGAGGARGGERTHASCRARRPQAPAPPPRAFGSGRAAHA